jgi:hypothetical protein
MPKPILRVGSSSHIGDFTAHSLHTILHIPLFFESVFVFCSAGQSGGPVGQTKGKNSPSTPQMAVKQPFNFFNPLQNAILR